jgi:hypothetical protein
MIYEKDVSDSARLSMLELGNYCPTVNEQDAMLKGCTQDGVKCYLSSDGLRELADHCIEVANWLDARAVKTQGDV